MDRVHIKETIRGLHAAHPQVSHFTICCISAFIGETGSVKCTTLSIFFFNFRIKFLVYTGARMPIYEVIRNNVFQMPPASDTARKTRFVIKRADDTPSSESFSQGYVLRAAAGGIISGALAQFICSPTDLLKVRLQTEQRKNIVSTTPVIDGSGKSMPIDPATKHPNRSTTRASLTMRQLIKEGGVLGLWRGGLPNVQRAALVNMGEMTTYDTAKRWLQRRFGLRDGPMLHGCASVMSGFVSACLGTPADFIKTRMMNQRLMTASGATLPPLYTGMIDCTVKVVKQEGFFTLYRGFFLIWGRMAPWSLTFWLTYEKMRMFIGAGGF
ncbi:unnamed protein product [Mesocestoides corti]|uniref:Mitochondrial uncoupling protein 4 n=1 Tax=Mesocestoides corti TaxID=53468 RepID=A0A0R3U3K7_MESCO|nr:unnamed protein product [Mesocestoides corti]